MPLREASQHSRTLCSQDRAVSEDLAPQERVNRTKTSVDRPRCPHPKCVFDGFRVFAELLLLSPNIANPLLVFLQCVLDLPTVIVLPNGLIRIMLTMSFHHRDARKKVLNTSVGTLIVKSVRAKCRAQFRKRSGFASR